MEETGQIVSVVDHGDEIVVVFRIKIGFGKEVLLHPGQAKMTQE